MKIWTLKMSSIDFSYLHFDLDKKGVVIGILGYLVGIDFQ